MNTYFNDVLVQDARKISKLQEELKDTKDLVAMLETALQYQKDTTDNLKKIVNNLHNLLASYQKQVDDLPADTRLQGGCAKIPDPPTFTGSELKQDLRM